VHLALPAVLIVVGYGSRNDADVRNLEAVRAVFSEVWSKGDLDQITVLFSDDFVGHFPGQTVRGPAGVVAQVTAHRSAFPDWTEEVEDEIVDRDRIAIRFTSRGTHLGTFWGNPPTGNVIEISEVALFRLTQGKISEQWVYPDILSLQRQLQRKERR
jgi:steroid delta-isomerase-like uncharacterized protein